MCAVHRCCLVPAGELFASFASVPSHCAGRSPGPACAQKTEEEKQKRDSQLIELQTSAWIQVAQQSCAFTLMYRGLSAVSAKHRLSLAGRPSCLCPTGRSVCAPALTSAVWESQNIKRRVHLKECEQNTELNPSEPTYLCSSSFMASSISSILCSSFNASACFFSACRCDS